MSPSIRTARWIGLASVFVLVAAAAFGAKLWHTAPKDFFLSLATASDTAEPTLPEATRDQPTGTAGSFARLGGGSGASARLDALPPAAAMSGGSAGAFDRQSFSGKGWTPWGSNGARRGLNGFSASGGSAALGGLWHTMSPFGGHGGGTADTPAKTTARAEPASKPAAAAKPAAKPSAKPSSPSSPSSAPSAPPSISAPSTAASAVPATGGGPTSFADPGSGLGEHETPLPDVGGGPGAGGGATGGGGIKTGGSSPGNVSANPEPGTIALVGTGLLGLIGAFRRRKA